MKKTAVIGSSQAAQIEMTAAGKYGMWKWQLYTTGGWRNYM